jgi:hypothetical protein
MQLADFHSVYGRGRRPTQSLAVLPRMRQACASSFPQDLSFKLGEDSQQAGHGATSWCGQVQSLGQGNEADAKMLQFLQCRQQILTERPHRSKRHTSTTSISRRRAASSSFSRASLRAPPEFTSRTGKATAQPRRAAYSRIARVCIASVC